MKRKKTFKILISLIVTLILLAILISQIKISDILEVLKKIPLPFILLAFLVYLIFNIFRTLRFQLLLNKKISFRELMPIILLHGFFLNVLPARTGEFSYLYLLKKRDIPLRETVSTLLIARVFDGIALASLFILSVSLLGETVPPLISNIFVFISLLLGMGILFLIVILHYGNLDEVKFKKTLHNFLNKTHIEKFNSVKWLLKKVSELLKGFQDIQVKKKVSGLLFYSFGIWIFGYLVYVILMEAMGIHLSIWAVFTGATFVVFSSLLPIQGLAGFGTTEGVWALVFFALGVPKELAITSGFSFHIIRLIYSTILGFFSLLLIKFQNEGKRGH